jgi:predicted transcriptional regulator
MNENLDTQKTIDSWRWRIVKAGYKANSFAKEVGVSQGAMSEYLNGKKTPSLAKYQQIENKLRYLEVLNATGL